MKIWINLATASMAVSSFSQTPDKTLDLNYTADYKSAITFKWSSRLAESQEWKLQSFTAGGAYNITKGATKFALTYDTWRANNYNANVANRFGIAYSAQSKFNSLNFTLFQTDGTNQNGFAGRIDLNMKFK